MKKTNVTRRDFVKGVGSGAVLAALHPGLALAPQRAEAAIAALGASSAAPPASPAPVPRRQGPEPEDPLTARTVRIAENMEPVIPHPEQQGEAQQKLTALEAKTGKKPNIIVVVMDNVGWGDPGIYGGELMVGAPTPNMDRLGREGLQLLSTYSQASCTPTRCTLLTGRLPMRHGQLRPRFC